MVTTIKDYMWRFSGSWELTAYRGTGATPGDFLRIAGYRGSHTVVTSTDKSPHAQRVPAEQVDLDVSWLLHHLTFEAGIVNPSFAIDRDDSECVTPRRNTCVTPSLLFFS